ncbi:MAG: type II toxin-antitoxin system CcdA family antitoxin [Haliea sp.]|nr:type II toxin-antitoxin system CcdA family antitoxin [Haliea sp.]
MVDFFQNRKAIKAYNQFIEQNGCFGDECEVLMEQFDVYFNPNPRTRDFAVSGI